MDIMYRGRKNIPTPCINFIDQEQDLPLFEPISHAEGRAEAPQPHDPPPHDTLSVVSVDMCISKNKYLHHTLDYENPRLVVRRGQEFCVRVTFNRPLNLDVDEFQVEFLIGSNPTPTQGSLVAVQFPTRPGSIWKGVVEKRYGAIVTLTITPRANAIVGLFRTYVAVMSYRGMVRTSRNPDTDFYLLFNAWCPEDEVYLPSEQERNEYVLNDYGVIYHGEVDSVAHRPWIYGQFEKGVLDSCIFIMDKSYMPIYNRGNAIKVARKASAMVNAQDDNGILVGRWDGMYHLGTPPTLWMGSVKMLLKYAHTGGTPICYAQCWVYAGVFNAFIRCLGIPCRVITNFCSAHDNTGNLKTDLIFLPGGGPDRRRTTDSIWNYHCWNEMFMTRQDLPDGFGGWQAVDSTPQETSDGHYRCGPTSVKAIKNGNLGFPFDAPFVFAEVNSDIVFYKSNKYGTLVPFYVNKTHVGKLILTKGVDNSYPSNITHTYKYPEGSSEDEATMELAEKFGCERDHSEMLVLDVTAYISLLNPVRLGQDFNLALDFHNAGAETQEVQVHLTGTVVFYTGATLAEFMNQSITVTVDSTEQVLVRVSAEQYMPVLKSERSLLFTLCGNTSEDDQDVTAMKIVTLQGPELKLMVSEGTHKVDVQMYVTVEFTNPFNFALEKVELELVGPGLFPDKNKQYSTIASNATVSWMESFTPQRYGERHIVAGLDCDALREVTGETHVFIEPKE